MTIAKSATFAGRHAGGVFQVGGRARRHAEQHGGHGQGWGHTVAHRVLSGPGSKAAHVLIFNEYPGAHLNAH